MVRSGGLVVGGSGDTLVRTFPVMNVRSRQCSFLRASVIRQPICGLDGTCLTGEWLCLDRAAATAIAIFLPLPALPSFRAN